MGKQPKHSLQFEAHFTGRRPRPQEQLVWLLPLSAERQHSRTSLGKRRKKQLYDFISISKYTRETKRKEGKEGRKER